MATVDLIEDAIVDEFAGRITRTEAVARLRAVLDLTEFGALDLITHPVSPRFRYAASRAGESSD